MKGCRTIAEYAVKKWMEDNGFEMSRFSVEMNENAAEITDKMGKSMTVHYNPETKTVEVKEKKNANENENDNENDHGERRKISLQDKLKDKVAESKKLSSDKQQSRDVKEKNTERRTE